jgi:hypothetical protein
MAPVAVNENYLKALQAFGDVDALVGEAVEDYLTRRIIERIKVARERVAEFETKYEMAYSAFSERTQLDEAFYNNLRQANPLWEQDSLEWMYWDKEVRHWTEKLNDILNKS